MARPMRDGNNRLLVVGKGLPDGGGIAAWIRTFLATPIAHARRAEFLNLAHEGTPEGGRVSSGNLGRTARDAWRVWRASRRCDVVHVHSALAPGVTMIRAGLLAAAAAAAGSRPIIHAHGGRLQLWLNTPSRRLLARLVLAPARQVLAVSDGGRDALVAALGPARVRQVDNGVDVQLFGPREPAHHPPRIVYVGLLTPRKGVLDLLEASRLLAERGVDHVLWLVGGTPDEGPDAERQVLDAVQPGVRLVGEVDYRLIPEIYRQADVFCLPSWWEAMSLSVLEAMASGLPVVATAVGDNSRVVVDGVTGRLVAPRSPIALADALEEVLRLPAAGEAMGLAGRKRVAEHYSCAALSATLSEVYESVTGTAR